MRSIGVCSWSLQPASPRELVERVRATGLSAVQLALDPLRHGGTWADAAQQLQDAGIRILSGMMTTAHEDYSTLDTIKLTGGVRPDQHWSANLATARECAAIAESLSLRLVTFHAGFLPHGHSDPERRERDTMIDRLAQIARLFADRGVRIALETGQESAGTLAHVLHALAARGPGVGVNFDPANMILYAMGEPVAAITELAPWVRQIHIKDATPASTPGHWGTEVVVGTGSVNWPRFFEVVNRSLAGVDLVIEREAGTQRVNEIRAARSFLDRAGIAGASR